MWFTTGLLSHAPLRHAVLGPHNAVQARLGGYALRRAEQGSWPVMVADATGFVDGLLLDLSKDQAARLIFFMAAFRHQVCIVQVPAAQGDVSSTTLHADTNDLADWDSALWHARFADLTTATAVDIMRLYGHLSPEVLAPRLNQMFVRAASRRRAESPTQSTLRHEADPADIRVTNRRLPYAQFFAVEEYDISWRRFDGTMNCPAPRTGFIGGDAVTVLPYDPVRDRVLVIEQFRAGPYARGDAQCWSLEAVAGRIDAGETPEVAGRREALEEAGLVLTTLLPVANYYPSPGAVSEYLYSFVALTNLPDGSAGVFGLAEEAEDIRGHLIAFDRLMALVTSGEINNAPLILTALWLQRARASLRNDGQIAHPTPTAPA